MVAAVEVQKGRERRLVVGWRGLGRKDKEELLSKVRAHQMTSLPGNAWNPSLGPFWLRAPDLWYIKVLYSSALASVFRCELQQWLD